MSAQSSPVSFDVEFAVSTAEAANTTDHELSNGFEAAAPTAAPTAEQTPTPDELSEEAGAIKTDEPSIIDIISGTAEPPLNNLRDRLKHLPEHLQPNKYGIFPITSLARKPADPMMRITHIFDMDGFIIRDKFLCKEAAIVEVGNGRIFYEHFKLPYERKDLLPFEIKEIDYVTEAVHGILFENRDNEVMTQEEVAVVVRSFLNQGIHNPQDIVVGYKGGTLEKDLLDEMGIRSFNMEFIGCPKYDHLVSAVEYKSLYEVFKVMDYPNIFCSLHVRKTVKEVVHHCAKSEVCMFRRWYLHYYLGL